MIVSQRRPVETPCSLGRRAGAMFYDALIIIAIWALGATLVVIPSGKPVASGNLLFQLYLLALAFGYLYASWNFRGQTLGMRAWRIRLVADRGRPGFGRLAARFATALISGAALGVGFFWALGRRDRATWHDLVSGTRLVHRSTE